MSKHFESALRTLMVPKSPWVKNPEERAAMTISCQDGDSIPRVKNAGEFTDIEGIPVQIMHNGLYVKRNGYQGRWQAKTIKELRGIHEPQEEKVFYEVLKRMRKNAVMMELGSWWSYYSMWFLKSTQNGHAICCEPDPTNLELGKTNMRLNGFNEKQDVVFYNSAAGENDHKIISFKNEDGTKTKVPIRTVDSIVREQKIDRLDLLHMDIQGHELATLMGAKELITSNKLRFLFISTHHYSISEDPLIHQKCLDFIKEHGGTVISKHTILESCSGDGLIVASFDKADKDFRVEVSHQSTDNALFRQYEYDVDIMWKVHEKMLKVLREQEKDIEQLRNELDWKSKHIDHLERTLSEIGRLPDHIKKQVKHRISHLKVKRK